MNPCRIPYAHRLPALLRLLIALAALSLAGCSGADRAVASGIIGAAGGAAPLVCQFLGADASKVCGLTTGAVSDVAKLVASILSSLPAAARKLDATALEPTVILVDGCTVELPRWQAEAVLGKLRAKP